MNQTVLVLDFGSQYSRRITRKVRELNVFCEVVPFNTPVDKLRDKKPIGLIFCDETNAFVQDEAKLDERVFDLGIPILGICYGAQLIAEKLGGILSSDSKDCGKEALQLKSSKLIQDQQSVQCYDNINVLPKQLIATAFTNSCKVAAFESQVQKLYGVQFYPQLDCPSGEKILRNFLFDICGANGDWTAKSFAKDVLSQLKSQIGDQKVLCALSGGVDSAVAAALVHKACPNLTCIFVDHGLLRQGEAEEVVKVFKDQQQMNVIKVDAADRFLGLLRGVSDPEQKRKIIGGEFIRVFEEEAKKVGSVDFLVQGTIYPDVIESGVGGTVIKSHHNVGGLPDVIDFKQLVEPLRTLFKEEVRALGLEIGLPESIVMRQPFPGPGLAIRIIGDITKDKLEILKKADFIFRDELKKFGQDKLIWQYFAVLLNTRSVGVSGDQRTYDYTVALRGVTSIDGMVADWARIPYDVLESVSNRIAKEAKHINRVVYDITAKPPATIEWE